MEILLQAICITTLIFVFSGYIYYKMGKANTWEQGILKLSASVFDFLYEGATGKKPIVPEKEIDVRLYLSSEELLKLTKRLETVYEQPHLASGVLCLEDIAWFDYFTYRIKEQYRDLPLNERARLLSSIIRKFYQEMHGVLNVPVYIKVCSDYRLYFAIALNQAGINYLNDQEQFTNCTEEEFLTEHSSKIIEESIPEERSDDFRL